MIFSYLGVGSNLNNPLQQVKMALCAIGKIEQSCISKASSLYCTHPWGVDVASQPLYINCVVLLETSLSPLDLLKKLLFIENQQGRVRHERLGPRTLDLDILLYGDSVLETEDLVLPHPRMMQRDFVLYPLAEIAPQLQIALPQSETRTVEQWRDGCVSHGIYRLQELTCHE